MHLRLGQGIRSHHRQTPWASVTESRVRSRRDGAPRTPRYFFQVIDGKEMLDTVGTVEARAETIVVSGEMLKDLGGTFWYHGEWQVRVEDEAGNRVCALTFSADRQHLQKVALPPRP